MTKNERMRFLREALGLSQKEFAEKTGLSQSNISAMEKGLRDIGHSIDLRLVKTLGVNPRWQILGVGRYDDPDIDPLGSVEIIRSMFPVTRMTQRQLAEYANLPFKTVADFFNYDGEKSPEYVQMVLTAYLTNFLANMEDEWEGETGDGEMQSIPYVNNKNEAEPLPPIEEFEDAGQSKSGSHFLEHADGTIIMSVPLVEASAQAGYPSGWNDAEYLDALPRHSIVVDRNHRGVYRAFRVRGESMNDGTNRSIMPGDIVTGRRIEKHHWTSKLHLHKFKIYLIVQEDGIIVKVIVNHDVENGIIYCRSLNQDKDLYPDFDLGLDSVIELYNVVAVDRKFEF